ncbi:hypothetical protein DRO02_01500 [archaeon]|nr:MAG: hypothetical protein DRO02_01500 [archaeon]RLG66375.1 MAG: hypothetical protein DRN89_01015 [archaeon]
MLKPYNVTRIAVAVLVLALFASNLQIAHVLSADTDRTLVKTVTCQFKENSFYKTILLAVPPESSSIKVEMFHVSSQPMENFTDTPSYYAFTVYNGVTIYYRISYVVPDSPLMGYEIVYARDFKVLKIDLSKLFKDHFKIFSCSEVRLKITIKKLNIRFRRVMPDTLDMQIMKNFINMGEAANYCALISRQINDEDFSALEESDVAYVIISPGELSSYAERLLEWKRSRGVKAELVLLSWIKSTYPGRDTPEKIRNFLKDAYNKWHIKWALLFGDYRKIPVRYIFNPDYLREPNQGSYKPTDYYYMALDGSFDEDHDGIYGERKGLSIKDEIDWMPDIAVGRIPVSNEDEAENVVDKIISFESTPTGQWFKRALLCGAIISFSQGGYPGIEGAETCENIARLFPRDYNITKLYESSKDYHNYHNLTRSSVVSHLNIGYGCVNFVSHGGYDSLWRVYKVDSREFWDCYLWRMDALMLSNKFKLSVVYAASCNTGAIDRDSLAEGFILNPYGGGAIAYVGASRVSWASPAMFDRLNNHLDYIFWQTFLNPPQDARIGSIFFTYKVRYSNLLTQGEHSEEVYRKEMTTYTLYGDPETPILRSNATIMFTDFNGIPLNNVEVNIYDTLGIVHLKTIVNSTFSIVLPYGTYNVKVVFKGVEVYAGTITVRVASFNTTIPCRVYNLEVTVLDGGNRPLPNATVKLTSCNGSVSEEYVSNASGVVKFTQLPLGIYLLQAFFMNENVGDGELVLTSNTQYTLKVKVYNLRLVVKDILTKLPVPISKIQVYKNGELILVKDIDSNEASIRLPEGSYTVKIKCSLPVFDEKTMKVDLTSDREIFTERFSLYTILTILLIVIVLAFSALIFKRRRRM